MLTLKSIAGKTILSLAGVLEKIRLRGIARLFSLIGPIVNGRGIRLVECVSGFRIMADPEDYANSLMIYGRYHSDLISLLRELVKPDDRVIDVGAQLGFVTLHLSRLVGSGGRVYSIEPDPNALERLRVAILENCLTNVSVLPVAASNISGEMNFYVSPTIGSSMVCGSGQANLSRILVRGVPIDVMITDGTITGPISFVKIDTEGFECSIIDGMEMLIANDHPVIQMEVNPAMLNLAGHSTSDLISRITRHGYRAYSIHFLRRSLRTDRVELRTVNSGDSLPFCEVLCVPSEFSLPLSLPVG